MSATTRAGQAAREIVAGDPGPSGRRWLGWISLISLLLFAADTWLVLNNSHPAFDVPLERAAQAFPWGPLAAVMTLTNASGGVGQYALGIAAVLALLVYERRAGYLMALGALASVFDAVLKVSIGRHRPTADLVTILNPVQGYSYPSGHAVFFTWLCFIGAASLAPRLSPRGRVALWAAAGAIVLLACLGRVWAGAHWPSDVAGGFLLGLAWSAFVLWLPERWLPSPSMRWLPWRRAAARS
ncbi:MAG TPA: phosphatase PAP2 family protein [Candidatus Dormibacteraeota bacterium]|nr:phosphatase PAP2 family protein [Candidatus Dormibacteraeota bacterium]